MAGWVKAGGYTSLVRGCVCVYVCVGGEVFLDDPPARISSSLFIRLLLSLCWPEASSWKYLNLDTWKVKVLVAQLCLTLCDPMDYSPPGPSVHGILQARILEWVVIPFSRGSSQPRDLTQVSCIASRFFTVWVIREAQIPEVHSNTQLPGIRNFLAGTCSGHYAPWSTPNWICSFREMELT